MDNYVTSITQQSSLTKSRFLYSQPNFRTTDTPKAARDILDIGSKGNLSDTETTGIIYERAMAKLKAVVDDARAQLGLAEGEVIDTSAEATAGRIADFAIGAFEAWRSHSGRDQLSDEDARAQFSEFIGAAVTQGIDEARGILGALNALNPDVGNKIDSIADLVQARLDAFVANGAQSS
jgi:Domain of unknown function (DUF5610)